MQILAQFHLRTALLFGSRHAFPPVIEALLTLCRIDSFLPLGVDCLSHLFSLGVCWHAVLFQVTDVHRLLPDQQQHSSASSSSSRVLTMLDQLCAAHLLAATRNDGQFPANCLYGFARVGVPAPHLFEALVQRAGFNYCK